MNDQTRLEKKLGYIFKKKNLLLNSLTRTDLVDLAKYDEHSDYYVQTKVLENIGDSVLDIVIRKKFYSGVSNVGELDRKRQELTNNRRLSQFSLSFDLQKSIFWSDNEKMNKIWFNSNKVLADCFESIIGAVFLDSDLKTVEIILDELNFFDFNVSS